MWVSQRARFFEFKYYFHQKYIKQTNGDELWTQIRIFFILKIWKPQTSKSGNLKSVKSKNSKFLNRWNKKLVRRKHFSTIVTGLCKVNFLLLNHNFFQRVCCFQVMQLTNIKRGKLGNTNHLFLFPSYRSTKQLS